MKQLLSIILYIIMLYFTLVYSFNITKEIDDKIWFNFNKNIFAWIERGFNFIWNTIDGVNEYLSSLRFNTKSEPEDYIYDK